MRLLHNSDAQLMLLAGFMIAIGLVITTIMLSSAIFAENMAIVESRDPSRNDIMNIISITKEETREAYNNSTLNGVNNSIKFNNFSQQMQNFNGNLSKIYALHGEIVNITWENWTNKGYATFSDNGTANGISNWDVIENVSKSNITVYVTSGTLYINLTNNTPDWQKEVNNSVSPLYINTSNVSYKIIFLNGANASGTYSITGIASGKWFIRARDYVINTSITFASNRVKADFRIPVSVPW